MISTGILHYNNDPLKLILLIDQDLVDYYRSLVPKSLKTNPQKYSAHISIIRNIKPPKMAYWAIYEGEEIEFSYEPTIEWSDTYIWLPVKCKRFEDIRVELGLDPIVPWTNGFHFTIGNFKT